MASYRPLYVSLSGARGRRPCRPPRGGNKEDYDSSWAVAECRDHVAVVVWDPATAGNRYCRAEVRVSLMEYVVLQFDDESDEEAVRRTMPTEHGFVKLPLERRNKCDTPGGWYICSPCFKEMC